MSDHIFDLLGAYLDGELNNGQLRKVETHLFDCQICQEEYASLHALSDLLSETTTPEFPSGERLAADVALRLPRVPVLPMRRKVLEVGWWLIPVSLIVTWIFISTTFLVSDMVRTANDFRLLSSASILLESGSSGGANYSAFLGQLGFLESDSLQWIASSESFTRNVIANIFWQVAIAVFYLSWVAIWWARHTRQGFGQPLES